MDLLEHQGKAILAAAGVKVPRARLCSTGTETAAAAAAIGPVVIKAQIPAGKRGKAGGILFARGPAAAAQVAKSLLGSTLLGFPVQRVLVEERLDIARELYVAITIDAATKGPLLLLSLDGGQEVEAGFCGAAPGMRRLPVDILHGLDLDAARQMAAGLGIPDPEALAAALIALYGIWREIEAELVEINPLALLADGSLIAADCKITLDDSALFRHPEAPFPPEGRQSERERQGRELGLNYIDLGGEVGVLANGAGLTMTTVDIIAHLGGRAANFLEIGGDAYTKAKPALALVLGNPAVKSLVINFCGAYARTDVMVKGVLDAWDALKPKVPVFFSIHGTGATEAVRLLRDRLGIKPFERLEDAVRQAVEEAR